MGLRKRRAGRIEDLRAALADAEHEAMPMSATSFVHDRFVRLVAGGWVKLVWSALGALAAVKAGLKGGKVG